MCSLQLLALVLASRGLPLLCDGSDRKGELEIGVLSVPVISGLQLSCPSFYYHCEIEGVCIMMNVPNLQCLKGLLP